MAPGCSRRSTKAEAPVPPWWRPASPADGRAVAELDLDEDAWISLVIRDGQLIPVQGATTLRAGDEIIALTDPERTPDLACVFTAPTSS